MVFDYFAVCVNTKQIITNNYHIESKNEKKMYYYPFYSKKCSLMSHLKNHKIQIHIELKYPCSLTGWNGLAGMDLLAWTVIGYHGLILTTWVLTYLLTDGLTNGHWYLLSRYCD